MELILPTDSAPLPPPDEPIPAMGGAAMDSVDLAGLHIHGIGKSFGKRKVLQDVSFSVHRGEVAGLLGPNGAGKTTCFYIITGLVKPDSGLIYLDGNNLTATPMYQRARMGISYLAQEASIFRGMSVEQNILSVAELHERDPRRARELVDGLLDELHIGHLRKMPSVSLSGGERRRVEIARALATEPSFLLMDEPFAGLDPLAVDDIRKIVTQLRDRGLGILITDHNVRETLDIVDVASVIYDGSVLLEGTPREILSDPEVRRVYLGKAYAETLEQDHSEPAAAARPRQVFKPPSLAGAALPSMNLRSSLALFRGGKSAPKLAPAEAPPVEDVAAIPSEEEPVKKNNTYLVFGAGAIAGLVLGLFLGMVVLKPKGGAGGATDGYLAQQGEVASGAEYQAAFKTVDDPTLWTSSQMQWKHLPSAAEAGMAPVTFTMPTTPYAYGGIAYSFSPEMVKEDVIVRVDVKDIKGLVGASLVNPAGNPILTQEQGLKPADGERSVFFRVTPSVLPASILFRNYGDTSSTSGSVTVTGVSYAPATAFSDEQMDAIGRMGLNKPLQ